MITDNVMKQSNRTLPSVFAESAKFTDAAEKLAQRLNVSVLTDGTSDCRSPGDGVILKFGENGLSLCGGDQIIRADFTRMIPRLKTANIRTELLVKAAKIKHTEHPLTAVDATAGFGEDSLLLAAAGFSVCLYEYNPVIAALLDDAMRRAAIIPELAAAVGRMTLCEGDSIIALRNTSENPDVILLDPMFPERQKSALVKKKFQLLHMLESPCGDENALLEAALSARPAKIIIKRPLKGPYLAEKKPSYSISGKAIRYDCIVP